MVVEQNKKSCVYPTCKFNSECFSNKSIDNYCVFNDENPIVHSSFKSSYMYYGDAYRDIRKNNDECSSRVNSENGY
ncbi:hypothetical protein BCR32DRAFT_280090 [Anaeromyces robustus]|uniref:Uncharacterized protein n=1 Tax=Anaeromyces robustus TaxID=1754192 RepID=A0A1Y1X586_9FUNG|nr:hypothetical protein BCR32DRAFT_280090 [Anaeromyces robustus]|eukprot:ORX80981.1 hypothetical protein BCR32DRAFT_280090 [Anaeromyces robustus]